MTSYYQIRIISSNNLIINKLSKKIKDCMQYLFCKTKSSMNSLLITLFKPDAINTNQLDIIEKLALTYNCTVELYY